VSLVGDLPGFGAVYYHPNSLANILFFHDLATNKQLVYDSTNYMFIVEIDGKVMTFTSKGKLYVSNARSIKRKHSDKSEGIVMVETVEENMKMFTNRQETGAETEKSNVEWDIQVLVTY
jgi:hypothetical protein